jgi:hypothetical protein
MTIQTPCTLPQPRTPSVNADRPPFPNMPGPWITSRRGR